MPKKDIPRIEINDYLERLTGQSLEGSIDFAIKTFVDIKHKYPDHKLHVTHEGDSWGSEFEISGTRPETDEEYEKRKALLERRDAKERERKKNASKAKKERDLKELARLKALYEKDK
jgi:hypothetical protein